jgi:RNA polymerase sigma-70 factor (ECF subfamily)
LTDEARREERERRRSETRRLLTAARSGDHEAFRRFVESHMRAVYAIGHRMMGNHDDADDIAQETFVRAWQALDRYDARFSPYTWLRTIATRLAVNELEKRRRRQTEGGERFDAAAETRQAATPDPAEELDGREARARVEQALAALPPDYRAALILRTYEELSYEEIARELEIPIGTVMSRIHRARRMLRERLEGRTAPLPKARREDSST